MIFFFSSRRRHTRWPRDWSSDVCSSDLKQILWGSETATEAEVREMERHFIVRERANDPKVGYNTSPRFRSEERRVGKECRAGWPLAECKTQGTHAEGHWTSQ